MDIATDDFNKTSKFNSGVPQLTRIDELWKLAHKHSLAGRMLDWNNTLDRVWCELAGDFPSDDPKVTKYLDFNTRLSKINLPLSNGQSVGFKNPYQGKDKELILQKALLIDKEVFIRRTQNGLGKGTAYADEDEDNFN